MAQIMAGDIRKGVTFEYKSGVYTVTEFQHVKPGKGAAFVRCTLKNVVTGQVLSDETFNPTAKLETAQVETKKMTYSYTDGEFYYFMDEIPSPSSSSTAAHSPSSPKTSSNSKSSRQSPACAATRRPTSPRQPKSKRARPSRSPCSSTRATPSASIPARASTWAESKDEICGTARRLRGPVCER